jgi:hypothetical protein
MNTGLESRVEDRAEEVETIVSPIENLRFEQRASVPIWRYDEASKREMKSSKEVQNSSRHWWIITENLLENIEPPITNHADIFDLLLALNLCIDQPIAFSQSPGQTVGGTYRVQQGRLNYRGDLSPGSLPLALLTMNEMPSEIHVSESVEEVFEMVREFRSASVETDEDMDIRIGLHMYDDALTSSLWTTMSNLFFVCEKVLCSGRSTKPDNRITGVTEMKKDEAANWRKAVNRLKHPDKGDVPGLVSQPDLEVPSLEYMRRTTNTALIQTMRDRFDDFSNTD